MIRALADEQLAGRLRIAPRAVNSSSEVLTAEARAMATRAWRVPPFNVYAATETGGIAAECPQHRGMHLFEDLVIPEVVDNNYRPVPPGETGRPAAGHRAVQPHHPAHPLRDDRPGPARHPSRARAGCRSGWSTGSRDAPTTCSPSHARRRHRPRSTPSCSTRSSTCSTPPDGRSANTKHGLRVLIAAPGPGFDPNATESALHEALTRAGARPPAICRLGPGRHPRRRSRQASPRRGTTRPR